MMSMKRFSRKFRKLNSMQKIEFVIASVLTLVLFIGFPVYAWFSRSNDLETMTKVKEPDNLDIRAGNFDQIVNFDLSDIDIEDMAKNNTSRCYVFSVSAGDYKINYDLQLAHTTNIPFKYTLWKASQVSTDGEGIVQYHPLDDDTDVTYYSKDSKIQLEPLNADDANAGHFGRTLAQSSGDYYDITYDKNDNPEIYAVPMYLQTITPITQADKGSDKHDYFILELEWDQASAETGFSKWNKAENNKETDIIYITAVRSTG